MKLLETRHLNTFFPVRGGIIQTVINHVKAVNDVSIYVEKGEIVSVVGESGCGKSTLGFSVLGLVPVTSGEVFLADQSIDTRKPAAWDPFRRDFQIIFQDPYTSLNPRHTVFRILSEPLLVHGLYTKRNVKEGVSALLEQVGLSPE